MPEIKLRPASESDAQALLEIYSHYVENTAITFEWEVPSVEEFRNRIHTITQKYPYLVAEKNGTIVGYAYANTFRTRAAYSWTVETSIYVHKDYRREGIGKLLLVELEKELAEQNVLNVYACITSKEKEDEYSTHDSIRFHEKMGYTRIGEFKNSGLKFNRWYDVVFMEKILGSHSENPSPVIPLPLLRKSVIF